MRAPILSGARITPYKKYRYEQNEQRYPMVIEKEGLFLNF